MIFYRFFLSRYKYKPLSLYTKQKNKKSKEIDEKWIGVSCFYDL